jgi:hypothetical protein
MDGKYDITVIKIVLLIRLLLLDISLQNHKF